MTSNANKSCAVATCPNPKGVSYHRFPKEASLRSKWVKSCGREKPFDPNSCRICERHFYPIDYERDLKNELLGLPTVKKLKKDSYPKRNLPGCPLEDESESQSARKELLEAKEKKAFIESILRGHQNGSQDFGTQGTAGNPSLSKYKSPLLTHKEPIKNGIGEALLWKQKFLRLQTDHKKAQSTSNLLRQELRAAKKEVRKLKSQKHQKTIIKEFLLKNNYSASQVKKLMNPKLKFCQSYDKDEMTMSLVLRSISKKAFEYIRSKNVLPLPCKRTQAKWLNEFKNTPGLQEDYLKILQEMDS